LTGSIEMMQWVKGPRILTRLWSIFYWSFYCI